MSDDGTDRPTPRRRRPGWVYDEGQEPDYRFSFANERTFLAWIRTAFALVAGGVAVDAVTLDLPHHLQQILAGVLLLLGLLAAISSWFRWGQAERAIRRGEPLPSGVVIGALSVAIAVIAIALLVTL